jgi:hypothetical protein
MIAPGEVLPQPLQTHAQQPGGQVAAFDRGPDQKPAQTYHPVELLASLLGIPTNPTVPIGQQQRRCGKSECTQQTMLRLADNGSAVPPVPECLVDVRGS